MDFHTEVHEAWSPVADIDTSMKFKYKHVNPRKEIYWAPIRQN